MAEPNKSDIKPDSNAGKKNEICNLLEEGVWKKDAAVLVGIDESTLYKWFKADASFSSRAEASILKYKHKLIKVINAGSITRPMVAVEVLKTRWPDEWNRSTPIELVRPEDKIKKVLELIKEKTQDEHTNNLPSDGGEPLPEQGGESVQADEGTE